MVLYAHGTSPDKAYDIADLPGTYGNVNDEGVLLATVFAARGYIVVAPNYAGYDTSTFPTIPIWWAPSSRTT